MCARLEITQWTKDSLFKDASPTNIVTSTMSTTVATKFRLVSAKRWNDLVDPVLMSSPAGFCWSYTVECWTDTAIETRTKILGWSRLFSCLSCFSVHVSTTIDIKSVKTLLPFVWFLLTAYFCLWSFSRTASTDYSLDRFFWATRFLFLFLSNSRRACMVYLQVKLCDPCFSALRYT